MMQVRSATDNVKWKRLRYLGYMIDRINDGATDEHARYSPSCSVAPEKSGAFSSFLRITMLFPYGIHIFIDFVSRVTGGWSNRLTAQGEEQCRFAYSIPFPKHMNKYLVWSCGKIRWLKALQAMCFSLACWILVHFSHSAFIMLSGGRLVKQKVGFMLPSKMPRLLGSWAADFDVTRWTLEPR